MILLHYTGMQTGQAALDAPDAPRRARFPRITWCSRTAASSNACPRRCAPGTPANRPGPATTDINSRSIGIEIVNPGHDFGYPDYPLRQIAAVIALCRTILTRRGPISADRILGHSDVAPVAQAGSGREISLGAAQRIRRRPLGAPGPARSRRHHAQARRPRRGGDAAAARLQVLRLRHRRKRRSTMTSTRDVVTAFQRHFRQARVDGIADPSTLLTLRALIETRPAPLGS